MDPFAKVPDDGHEDNLDQVLPEVSEEEARPVREIIQVIHKTKRAYEMYPENNPILQKFREDLVRRFNEYFSTEETMPLILRQYDIFYKGVSVYHSDEKEDNLALMFYKDGLRELTFREGIPEDEILDFIDIIRARPESSVESYDDDIVTLLWEKDFIHLSYYVVEEFTEGSTLEAHEVQRLMSHGSASDADLQEAYEDAQDEESSEEGLNSPLETIAMGFNGVFSLSEEEVKALKEEMSGLNDERFLQTAIDILFEALYLDRGTPDFLILMDNLSSAFGYLIESGALGPAALILKRLGEMADNTRDFNKDEVARYKRFLSDAGNPSGVKKLVEMFASGKDISEEEFRLFLGQLDRNAIIPLFNLAGEINSIEHRKVVLDALATLGRTSMDVLAGAVKDKRWEIARNAVAILGRIGDKSAVDHLRVALQHEEPKVRREAIRSLGMIGGPKAGDVLLLALDDTDQQIRISALRFMPRAQSYSLLDSLIEYMTRAEFNEKAFPEKRAFFEVLAEIGQERALPLLLKILRKKSLIFSSAKKDELRVAAAYGMGNINHVDALDALTKEKKRVKKGSPLADAISLSIKKLEKPLSGGAD